MAATQTSDAVSPNSVVDATAGEAHAPLAEPAEAHERPASLSSHESSNHELAKPEQASGGDARPAATRVQSTTESIYPPRGTVVIVMTAILLALFLNALDRTIIATAIPKITDDFNSLDDVGWYGSAYLLTCCCFQMLWGRIYTFYTPKYVFLLVIVLFEVGSALCGAAPNSVAFIIGRAIAGIGAAGIQNGGVILLVSVVPLAKRPKVMGLFGAVFGVASVVGPLLGGAFTSDVSWRWCFYINLPIGGVVLAIIAFTLKPTEASDRGLTLMQQLKKLDLLGELFLFPCVICLLLALQWGGSTYKWSDGRIIALFVVFGVLAIAFCAQQYIMRDSGRVTIPLHILKNRSILAGMWFQLSAGSVMMILIYYIPIWFQAIKGNSAVESGIRTIPLVLSLVVGAISAGQIIGRLGYYAPFMIASAVLMPIGAGLITTFTIASGEGAWIGYQVLFGFGLGLGMQQGMMAAQTVLGKKDVPTGVSLMFFTMTLGGAIFISVGQNVLDTQLVRRLTSIPNFHLSPEEIVNTGATNLRSVVPAADLQQVLVQYNLALREVFIVGVAVAAMAILGAAAVEWRSVKGKQGPTGGRPKSADAPVQGDVQKKETAEEKV